MAARARLPRACEELEAQLAAGLTGGVQLAVRWLGGGGGGGGGEARQWQSAGAALGALRTPPRAPPHRPLRAADLMNWQSISKVLTTLCVATLVEQGKLALDDLVVKHFPEFCASQHLGSDSAEADDEEGLFRKDRITIAQLMNHTHGVFRTRDPAEQGKKAWLHPFEWEWHEVLQIFCEKLVHAPGVGRIAAYNATEAFTCLGEIVQRLSGRTFRDYVVEEVLRPLGLDESVVPAGAADEAHFAGFADTLAEFRWGEGDADGQVGYNTLRYMSPSCGLRSSAGDVAKIGECLLRHGWPVLRDPATLAQFTHKTRGDMFDIVMGCICDWTHGLVIDWWSLCNIASAGFGCGGAGSSIVVVDPQTNVSIALAYTHRIGSRPGHYWREARVIRAVWADLGLEYTGDPSRPRFPRASDYIRYGPNVGRFSQATLAAWREVELAKVSDEQEHAAERECRRMDLLLDAWLAERGMTGGQIQG